MTLTAVSPTSLLSRDEEVALARRVEAGVIAEAVLARRFTWASRDAVASDADLAAVRADGQAAREVLVGRNIGLVWFVVNPVANRTGLEADELFQEGVVGVLEAVERFDPDKGGFATFALTRIHLPTPAQAPSVPAHHILLIDASGSMWGDMDQMQATLLRLFTAAELQAPHLRVSLLSYSSAGDVITHFTRASVAELQAVGGAPQRTVKGLAARGLTCISQALRAAVVLMTRGETTCVSLHTDGWANDPSPASERKALLAAADDLHRTGAWLSGIAYRTSSDFGLLSELAARCGGSAVLAESTRQVYDAIHSSTARAAGHVEPPVRIDVTPGSVVLFYSVSAGRCVLQREPGTLSISGLAPTDDRAAWEPARRTFIGASEIAAVCGLNPYDSALDVYAAKVLGQQRRRGVVRLESVRGIPEQVGDTHIPVGSQREPSCVQLRHVGVANGALKVEDVLPAQLCIGVPLRVRDLLRLQRELLLLHDQVGVVRVVLERVLKPDQPLLDLPLLLRFRRVIPRCRR